MTEIKVHLADAVKWADEYDGALFHALLTDSPYHLTTITKRFGKADSAPAQFGTDGVFTRASRGFMGEEWDGGDLAFRAETWEAFMKVMYPGAFGITFGGSRGWHRLAVAIEDAGFIIHPTIFGWAYGSGFPKATRVKANGFDGYRYGLQAMKPAVEPIIIFQKPYEGRPLDNITQTGAGVLNIDGTRIGEEEIPSNVWKDNAHPFGNGAGNEYETQFNKGRWPANFILMDEGAAEALDRQSGNLKSGKFEDYHVVNTEHIFHGGDLDPHHPQTTYGDEGGASRFFFQVQDQIDKADPIYYMAKPTGAEKEAGLEDMAKQSVGHNRFDTCANCGGYLLQNPDRPSACKCENPQRRDNELKNPHPTVKALGLTRYLATLLLPPSQFGPRRLFVPFAGVGSEMIGGMQAGWEVVEGVEITPKYIPVNEARVKYWRERGWQTSLF